MLPAAIAAIATKPHPLLVDPLRSVTFQRRAGITLADASGQPSVVDAHPIL